MNAEKLQIKESGMNTFYWIELNQEDYYDHRGHLGCSSNGECVSYFKGRIIFKLRLGGMNGSEHYSEILSTPDSEVSSGEAKSSHKYLEGPYLKSNKKLFQEIIRIYKLWDKIHDIYINESRKINLEEFKLLAEDTFKNES